MGSVGHHPIFLTEHGHVAYPPRPVGKNLAFSEHGHVAYQIKANHECSNMIVGRPPPPPTIGMGSVGHNPTFSEHGHVEYQNKENQECYNMVSIVCLQTFPL